LAVKYLCNPVLTTMLSPQEFTRYSKQTILPEIGVAGQELLKAASVLVVGAGGLGCPVLQYLAAAGVGYIGIVDGDQVNLSNLQRQVLYTANDIGKLKATVAQERLQALNPEIHIATYPYFIDASNVLETIKRYDIVVDGSDNFATRYLLNDACVLLDKPMVSGAIYRFEGQISVFNYKGGPTYRCIFPEPPGEGESPNCADIGVVATLPGIIGTMQANEVLKIIMGYGEVLSGKLLVIDTLDMSMRTFAFKGVAANKLITTLGQLPDYCPLPMPSIDYNTMQRQAAKDPYLQVIDVREPQEHQDGHLGGLNIPLGSLPECWHQLNREHTIIVYCASGKRSLKAATMLLEWGFEKVWVLNGGYRATQP